MEKHWMVYWTLSAITGLFLLFAVSEFTQQAEGLSASAVPLVYELDVGETQMLTWAVTNAGTEPMNLEFYAVGEGSELLVFEEFVELPSKTSQHFEIFVIVPAEHSDNVEYHPTLFALKRGTIGQLEDGQGGMIINLQMKTILKIKIGDNPIYTTPVVVANEEPKSSLPESKTVVEKEKVETLDEKLARINAANQENVKQEETPEVEITTYTKPDLEIDPEPIAERIEVTPDKKQDCDFWCWFFSIFGF